MSKHYYTAHRDHFTVVVILHLTERYGWRRPRGRLRRTWLRTVKLDLLVLPQDRSSSRWRQFVEMGTLYEAVIFPDNSSRVRPSLSICSPAEWEEAVAEQQKAASVVV